MEAIKDLLTGESFRPRRKNQKFKNPQNRIEYHNNKAYNENNYRAFISEPLKQNHKILMKLITEPNTLKRFSNDYLLGMGFNLSVLTHFEAYENKTLPALFNFIYIDLFDRKPTLTIYRKA